MATIFLASCQGAGRFARFGDTALLERFEDLHRRVYGVYDLPGRLEDSPTASARRAAGELHDFLAGTFAGDELSGEYVEHFTTLRRMADEHISVRVLEVDYEHLQLERHGDSLTVDADWSVGGVVTHQSHRHPRINRYRARYTLAAAQPGGSPSLEDLRITGTTLQGLERVASVRDLGLPGAPAPSSARGSLSLGDLLRSGVVDPKSVGTPGSTQKREPSAPP